MKPLIEEVLNSDKGLITIPFLQNKLKEEKDIIYSRTKLRQIMIDELHCTYGPVKSLPAHANSERSKILR